MLLELVEDLRRAHRDDVGIAGHGPAVLLQRVVAAERDRIDLELARRLVDQHFQRGHCLQRAVAAHRTGGDAARMHRHSGDVDLRDVVDADRRGRSDGGDIGGEVGKPAAVEHMIGGECRDLAALAIDPDPRAHLDRVAFDAALELLVAVVRQPHRPSREEHCRQRHVEHERGVVAAAEAAADMGELGVDVRGP